MWRGTCRVSQGGSIPRAFELFVHPPHLYLDQLCMLLITSTNIQNYASRVWQYALENCAKKEEGLAKKDWRNARGETSEDGVCRGDGGKRPRGRKDVKMTWLDCVYYITIHIAKYLLRQQVHTVCNSVYSSYLVHWRKAILVWLIDWLISCNKERSHG